MDQRYVGPTTSCSATPRLGAAPVVRGAPEPMLASAAKSNGKIEHWQKLRMDLAATLGRGVAMDDDTRELIAQLCARIGTIMEDASAVALSIPGISEAKCIAAIAEISDASARISALSAAVAALVR